MINNKNNAIYTIYIDENTTVTYDYENLNYGSFTTNQFTDETFQSTNPVTSFDLVVKHRSIEQNMDENFYRNVYYSPYNVNYLTTELSKLSLTDDLIFNGDDYYEIFREMLYKYITTDNENRYIYSIINNNSPYETGYTTNNVQSFIADELTFKLEYQFSNMKMLFIYDKNKQLKSIYYVKSFLYSTDCSGKPNTFSIQSSRLFGLFQYL
jgi:hypothetical protein